MPAPKRAYRKRRRRTAEAATAEADSTTQATISVPPQQVDVSVTGLLQQKAKVWQPILAAGAAFCAVVAGVVAYWNWAKLPTLVGSGTLQEVEVKLRAHVDDTKVYVVKHADQNAEKINEKVTGLSRSLGLISSSQREQALDALRRQEETFEADLEKTIDSISSLDTQVGSSPPDSPTLPFLTDRRKVLDTQKRHQERRLSEIRQKISRMERGERERDAGR